MAVNAARAARLRRIRVPLAKTGRPEVVLGLAAAGIIVGLALWLLGRRSPANIAWAVTTLVALLPLTWSVARKLKHGEFGVDVIALLAMVGSLMLGQELAGAVIAVMLSGGDSLERFAGGRAKRELAALVARVRWPLVAAATFATTSQRGESGDRRALPPVTADPPSGQRV